MVKEGKAQLHLIQAIDIPVVDIEITSECLNENIDEEALRKKIVQKLEMTAGHGNVEYIVHIRKGEAYAGR